MKRKLTFCLIIALIFAVLVPIAAFAASDRANFIDEDNNGICDNAGQRGVYFVDENNDGICDNAGQRVVYFVDENNDGICDNAAQRGCGNGNVNGRCGGMQRNGCQARCK